MRLVNLIWRGCSGNIEGSTVLILICNGETEDIMEAVKKEAVDFVNRAYYKHGSKHGLSSEDAEKRLEIFGYNKLEEKKESKFSKFLGFMWNPLSWVMEVAAVMAIALANGGPYFSLALLCRSDIASLPSLPPVAAAASSSHRRTSGAWLFLPPVAVIAPPVYLTNLIVALFVHEI
ncbi:hypothetical protein L1887_29313 [Cichorium endivia]|nr:hypothetical protein L1887_29313 [Cichorium endivia]